MLGRLAFFFSLILPVLCAAAEELIVQPTEFDEVPLGPIPQWQTLGSWLRSDCGENTSGLNGVTVMEEDGERFLRLKATNGSCSYIVAKITAKPEWKRIIFRATVRWIGKVEGSNDDWTGMMVQARTDYPDGESFSYLRFRSGDRWETQEEQIDLKADLKNIEIGVAVMPASNTVVKVDLLSIKAYAETE